MKALFKKYTYVILSFLLTSQGFAQSTLQGDSYKDAKSKGEGVIILTYITTPGFIEKDKMGRMHGLCVDIMQEFISHLEKNKGIKLKAQYKISNAYNFSSMLQSVKKASGGVFGLGNITITESRKQMLSFSPPFFTNVVLLIFHKNVADLQKVELMSKNFKGIKAYIVKGSINERRILALKKKYHPSMQLSYVASSPDAFKKVREDPKSFCLIDFPFYLEGIQNKYPIKRQKIKNEPMEHFGLAMPKDSDWAPIMAEFMRSYTKSVKYRKALADNMGDNVLRFLDSLKK